MYLGQPALLEGRVLHQRLQPIAHRFDYRHLCLWVPLSQLHALPRCAWFACDRPAVLSLWQIDHGPRNGRALLPWVRGLLHDHGVAEADGEIVLQTLPRLFGRVFNPVSFYWCFDRAEALRAVVCEVSNTFGERHNYLVAHPDRRPIASGEYLLARKCFHVSPFFPLDGEYGFAFFRRGAQLSVAIDLRDGAGVRLRTRLACRARALTPAAVRLALPRLALAVAAVAPRIGWQAFRLWRAGLPVHRKPPPCREETT